MPGITFCAFSGVYLFISFSLLTNLFVNDMIHMTNKFVILQVFYVNLI